ncbi:MAG: signal peptidase II [Bacteroidia bacterium]|nr:signal peptidase II [Bacteroidia bacterium]
MKPLGKYLLVVLAVIAIDQSVKLAVKLNMALYEGIPVLGTFFQIYFIENDGAAFGLTITRLLSPIVTLSDATGKLILTLFSILLVGLIGRYLYTIRHHRTGLPFWVALILGGALGNIIDRVFYGVWFAELNPESYPNALFYGRVVDMFAFDLWRFTWPDWVPGVGGQATSTPVFNVADAAISVGIVVLLVFQRRFFEAKPAAPGASSAANDATAPTTPEAEA